MAQDAQLLRLLEPSVRPTGAPSSTSPARRPVEQRGFEQLLREAEQHATARPLEFSAHARQRLAQRGIELTPMQREALNHAAGRAEIKGAQEALMMMDVEGESPRRLGLIVHVPNRTVLTVLDDGRIRDGVVTQIDTAVFVDTPAETVSPVRLNL